MNPDVFFENFELLADAPTGVQKLRELILQLAVRGKLVPQDPNDEPAPLLFEKILIERTSLLKAKETMKSNIYGEIKPYEAPFALPKSWEWHRLVEIFYQISVSQNKVKSTEIEEIGKFPVVDQGQNYIAGYIDKVEKLINLPGPVVIFGDHTRILKYVDFDFVAGADGVKILRPIRVYEKFFYLVLKSIKLEDRGYGRHFKILTNNLFPLAPLEEQKRIVSKVDELMALCDKLEARRQKKQEIQSKLNSAALDRMLSAENQEEFEQHWQRICENFDLLYDNPENVEKLKQAILQLAVQGKLVPQNPEDEPARVLIDKINNEKKKLLKEGTIKKNKSFSSIETEEIPNELPKGWTLEYLGNIILDFQNGTSKRNSSTGEPIPVLRLADIKNGRLCEDSIREINLTEKEALKYSVDKGDILVIRVNGSENLVGRFIPCVINRKWAYCDHLIRVKLPAACIDQYYLRIYAESFEARSHILQKTITTAGQKTINQVGLGLLPVLIPPLAEQRRIVEKVEQLMGLCDELGAKLRKEREDSEKLMEAVVKGLLEGGEAEKPGLEKPLPLKAAVVKLK